MWKNAHLEYKVHLNGFSIISNNRVLEWEGLEIQLLMINYGEGNGNPLQYSCLENPMDGGAW